MKTFALASRQHRGNLQALDRDGFAESEVLSAIHNAKPPFTHHLVDTELAIDGLAHPGKRIIA